MQTFLPYPDFAASLQCLDNKRLGKQRIEARQILTVLEKGQGAWYNHPATQMWKGYESALILYYNTALMTWIQRNFKNTMPFYAPPVYIPKMPWWFGNTDFHLAHKSNLVRKDSKHYRKFFPDVEDDLPYIWPTKEMSNVLIKNTRAKTTF